MIQWTEYCFRSCPKFNTYIYTHTFNTFTITSSQQMTMFFYRFYADTKWDLGCKIFTDTDYTALRSD